MAEHFKIGVGYSLINFARLALLSVIKPVCNAPFGKSPLVYRLPKGVFNIRPNLPSYVTTWDVTTVFTFIKSKPALTDCDLEVVFHKFARRLCLRKGQVFESGLDKDF